MTFIGNQHFRWWIYRRNYVTILHVTNNMLKKSASQLLIPSIFREKIPKIPAFRLKLPKILQDILLKRRTSVFIYLLLTAYFALTANGVSLNRHKMGGDAMSSKSVQDEMSSKLMTSFCRNCPNIEQFMSMLETFKENYMSHFSKLRFNRLCRTHGLNYFKCNLLYQRMKQIEIPELDKTEELSANNNILTKQVFDHDVTATPTPLHGLPQSMSVLSRRKRLAKGDRRLVYMYCRTSFVMEIQNNGEVVGSRRKTPNAILEIQSVRPGGIVRFFSPYTGYYLAMNEKGRLYGTKNYSSNCEFVERLEENMYSTYFSNSLPNERRRKRKKRRGGRRTRSVKKPWYVAIGRSGQARKATRIKSPASTAAQFLPRPLW